MTDDEIRKLSFPKGWPVPDDYLLELGRIASLWSTLENIVSVSVGKLAGFEVTDPKPFILVTHSSFPQRVDMLGSLCEQLVRSHPQLKDYRLVITELRNAQAQRNRFMHNGLGPNEEGNKVQIAIASARGSLKTSVKDVEITDIRRVSVSIHNATRALWKPVFRRDIPAIWDSKQV